MKARGFTLIEVLIVITLIAILASISMPMYQNSVRRSKEAVLKEDLFRMRDVINQFYADKNKWPQSLQDLVTEGYMRAVPEDPITQSAETWVTVPADPDPSNTAMDPGIEDVKSGAEGTALAGSNDSDWD